MSTFSQRRGLKPIRNLIQKESADEPLRNGLWNCLTIFYWNGSKTWIKDLGGPLEGLFTRLWVRHYQQRIDEILGYGPDFVNRIRRDFLDGTWNEMFDLLEFIPNNYNDQYHGGYDNRTNTDFISYANGVLEENLSAYRFVNRVIVEITSEEEITSIEEAISNTSTYSPVQTHLNRALQLLADRTNPDYRNSIKESISSIESFSSILTKSPKATLGQALNKIEKKHELHGALKNSFSSLYGYTSDENGVRHALLEESTLKQEDAKFMLVTCSAFINYLLVKTIEIQAE